MLKNLAGHTQLCSCGVMHCLFKADNPKRAREGEGGGGGGVEESGGVERGRERSGSQ